MQMSNFQLIFTGVLVFLILVGVGVFAAFGGLRGGGGVGKVTIWGTTSQIIIEQGLQELRQQDKSFQDVVYVQKSPDTYNADLINAMASGTGPDLFLITQDKLAVFTDKIQLIPYGSVSQSSFTNSYIDEARLFLSADGVFAMPLFVDPLVMYWNRDMLATAGVAQPPRYWNELLSLAPRLTVLDAAAEVQKSAVALGEWSNISYAKAILTALFLQAGDTILSRDTNGMPTVVFGATPPGAVENPAISALNFYTEFANPSKTTYSWNHSLPESQDAFTAGDVALYFGFASDYTNMATRNPNLRFSVALLPQIQGNSIQLTFGTLTGLAIPRTAANPSGALAIAQKLTDTKAITIFAQQTGLPPVRRDVAVDTSANAAGAVFVQSALIARAWLDLDPAKTDQLFKGMIESVISGGSSPGQAVSEVALSLGALLRAYVGR